ncbi:UNVERIFIED_CONTAM: hypothetical protein NCL1_45112 [Trichonephila clavipes]
MCILELFLWIYISPLLSLQHGKHLRTNPPLFSFMGYSIQAFRGTE